MRIVGLELNRLRMPLAAPFRTSFGVQRERDVLLLRVVTGGGVDSEGWGECVAMAQPLYSAEYVEGAVEVIERFLLPRLLDGEVTAETVGSRLEPVRGHPMAKAALEMGVLDAQLRASGVSLASYLGGTTDRCAAGVSVGIMPSIAELLDVVADYLDAGYVRIKLKIEPGWDLEPVRAVRERFGGIQLQVDANAAYTLTDAQHLRRLDDFDLLLVEQPLADGDLRQHAALARLIQTPVCLDESVHSVEAAADAIALGACQVINVKPGRVGGYLNARRIHDLCRANGVATWCGGMVETGIGRAANIALASLPGFTLPGDISASDRFYAQDLTEPLVLNEGHMEVPRGAGIGVDPVPEILAEFRTWQRWIAA